MKRNQNMSQLQTSYLFPQVHARRKQFLAENPEAKLISLGIGDTTEPIPEHIMEALVKASKDLGTKKGYAGYGPEQGMHFLREKIATEIYQRRISPEEVFVSDGAKCDLGRLQMMFGGDISIAVQDPAYPVYIDGSIIQGVKKIIFMPCTPENNFFPDLAKVPKVDLIYFCSPNNPTGAVATREQLQQLVAFAKKNGSIIIFDAAYSNFIQDPNLPTSIYEIPEAKEVAIEINSFSKIAGFTGVRLGWTVVPESLKYEDGTSVRSDWNRITTTLFNGASFISQFGGNAVLDKQGLKEVELLTAYYLENARLIRSALQSHNLSIYGGVNAPYLWVHFPHQKSWDVFQHFLTNYHIVTTPGSGFGPSGEGFLRFTAFGHRPSILEAASRLKQKP